MKSICTIIIATAAFLFCVVANATLITVEPDDFANGTDISNAVSGITLSIEGHPGEPVLSRDGTFEDGPTGGSNHSPTGSRVFGHNILGLESSENDSRMLWTTIGSAAVLRADFGRLADFVAIDVFANDDDTFQLEGYSATGQLLDSFNTGEIRGTSATMSISRTNADIAYILAFGVAPEGAGQLDNLRVNVQLVPEPTTLALMVLGIAGIGCSRRRYSN